MVIFPLKSVENSKFADMKIRIAISVLSLVSALSLSVSCGRTDYVSITGYAQGGSYLVKLNMRGVSAKPESLKHGIDSILNVIDRSVSGYNKSSLLSEFNAGGTILPDEVFVDLYGRCRRIWEETDGAVDVAAAPLFDIWGFGFTTDSLPSADEVAGVRENCGMGRLAGDISSVIAEDGTLSPQSLLADGKGVLPRLNFNAVAQGYSVDLIGSYLHAAGVQDMLVNVGGEIYADGVNPSGKAWTLAIDRPEDGNNTPGAEIEAVFHSDGGPCGIVTSGNYRKFCVRD